MIEKVRLNIIGMSCASCVASVERGLKRAAGVLDAEVFLLTNSAKVTFDSTLCNIESLIKAVQSVGYDATFDSVLENTESNLQNLDSKNFTESKNADSNIQTQNTESRFYNNTDFKDSKNFTDSQNLDSKNLNNIESKNADSNTQIESRFHNNADSKDSTDLQNKSQITESNLQDSNKIQNLDSTNENFQSPAHSHPLNIKENFYSANFPQNTESRFHNTDFNSKDSKNHADSKSQDSIQNDNLQNLDSKDFKNSTDSKNTESRFHNNTNSIESKEHIDSTKPQNLDSKKFTESNFQDSKNTNFNSKDSNNSQNQNNIESKADSNTQIESRFHNNADSKDSKNTESNSKNSINSHNQDSKNLNNIESKKNTDSNSVDSKNIDSTNPQNLASKDSKTTKSMKDMPNCHDINVAQMLKDSNNSQNTESKNADSNSQTESRFHSNADSKTTQNLTSKDSKNTESNPQDSKKTKEYKTLKQLLNHIETQILTPKMRLILSAICSVIILYITMFAQMLHAPLPQILQNPATNALIQAFIALCVMHFGRDFYIHGLKALFFLAPNMDSLVALGSLAGFLYSLFSMIAGFIQGHISTHNLYFEGVCVILTFVMIGKFIENNAKNKAMANAKKLLQKQDSKVYKLPNLDSKTRIEISQDSIQKGDYLEILEHSFIPVDCVLISPSNISIDESVLSGESLPINKTKGDIINAGCLNLESNIIVQAISGTKDSTLAKMQALIMDSLESKAKIAALADKISGFFVPCVIILALLSGAFWLFYENLQAAIKYFASTLLISCPCALGLATPMAILFANARANIMGIFFKDSKSLENIATCDYAIFDKTGTLTSRDFKVVSIDSIKSSNDEILRLIASCEKSSTHILARSICRAYSGDLYDIIESKNIINRGIHAILNIDSKRVDFIVGNATFMRENGLSINEDSIKGLQIYIARLDSKYELLGSITLQENLREDAKELIESLKQLGINSEILSGDSTQNVARVASILGMNFKGDCSPNDKLERIKQLQNEGKKVIMIGDGTNDAMALSRANVSIVMSSGANLSLEVGDIIYFNNHLGGIKNAVLLGRKALRNIKENLSFAFIYNAICIPIAMGLFVSFGVSLNPMLASLAMSLSSISVVTNATRLYYAKL